jgi:hypothetical protein
MKNILSGSLGQLLEPQEVEAESVAACTLKLFVPSLPPRDPIFGQ